MKQAVVLAAQAGARSFRTTKMLTSISLSLSKFGGVLLISLLSLAGSVLAVPGIANAQTSTVARHDGQHDFDFNVGVWHTHIRRLVHPLTGSNDWVELEGTVRVRKVWNGRAQLEELDAHGASGRLQGLTLFLYNPGAHQWGQYFANRETGVLNRPLIGEFQEGHGELFDQEEFDGRTVLTRFVWSGITADSHQVEESYSDDGGTSWEPHFIATLTRESPGATGDESRWTAPASAGDGARDFDFHFGEWRTHIHRLQKPLSSFHDWTDYDGTSVVSKVWGGEASLFELEATGPAGHIEGLGLRLFNPQSKQWSLNWASSSDGVMTTPMVGSFTHGGGRFYDQEEFRGRIITSRNGFYEITSRSSRFEQAFSQDAGKTWETNWIMTFSR